MLVYIICLTNFFMYSKYFANRKFITFSYHDDFDKYNFTILSHAKILPTLYVYGKVVLDITLDMEFKIIFIKLYQKLI